MAESIRGRNWTLEVCRRAPVAAVGDLFRVLGVEGPKNEEVEDVARDEPYDEEYAKGNVTEDLETEVFQQFRKLE